MRLFQVCTLLVALTLAVGSVARPLVMGPPVNGIPAGWVPQRVEAPEGSYRYLAMKEPSQPGSAFVWVSIRPEARLTPVAAMDGFVQTIGGYIRWRGAGPVPQSILAIMDAPDGLGLRRIGLLIELRGRTLVTTMLSARVREFAALGGVTFLSSAAASVDARPFEERSRAAALDATPRRPGPGPVTRPVPPPEPEMPPSRPEPESPPAPSTAAAARGTGEEASGCHGTAVRCYHMAPDACTRQRGCKLIEPRCMGVPTPCESLGTYGCSMNSFCTVSNNQCIGFLPYCHTMLSVGQCQGMSGCSWTGASCEDVVLPCESMATEGDCTSQTGCHWRP
jgi:hypothetical protein